MKTLKLGVISFFIGALLSVVPIAVYAACDNSIVYEGTTCQLTGENCDASVCVCAYNCGPINP